MITNGDPSVFARKTEIVDVANGLTCSNLAKFPVELSAAVGANLGATPVVCGGYSSEKCFRFKNSVWEEYASMKEKRHVAAAVMHNDKLHVFGGAPNGSSVKNNIDNKRHSNRTTSITKGILIITRIKTKVAGVQMFPPFSEDFNIPEQRSSSGAK